LIIVGGAPGPLIELAPGLEGLGFLVHVVESVESLHTYLSKEACDAVLLASPPLSEEQWLTACEASRRSGDEPVLLFTDRKEPQLFERASRAGAYAVLGLTAALVELTLVIDRAVEQHALRRELHRLDVRHTGSYRFGDILGASTAMQSMYQLLQLAAKSDASVLLTGETGTGKELVAEALHRGGSRTGGPFVSVNVSTLPESLADSELFGHERGSFTDAKEARAGLFREAEGGTLFLDEIGDLDLRLQPKLLRALQTRTVRPVGGSRELPFDARLIAATNQDLWAMVAQGSFREDLLYRLDVIHIDLPPLRSRGLDALLIAGYLLRRAARAAGRSIRGFSDEAEHALRTHAWPGNIRELENCIERAVALSSGEVIELGDLPEKLRMSGVAQGLGPPTRVPAGLESLREAEKRHIQRVLEAVDGRRKEAARILGVDRKTLYRKLLLYKLDRGVPE
jgi:two-component system response regulator HydG